MEASIYINTSTKRAQASLISFAPPEVQPRLQAHLKLSVYFFAADSTPALLSSPTFRVALKAHDAPTGSVLALLSAPTTLSNGYVFEWASIDSDALRALLGDQESAEAVLEIEWSVASKIERVAIPTSIKNAWIREDDNAPDPASSSTFAWLVARFVAGNNVTIDDDGEQITISAGSNGWTPTLAVASDNDRRVLQLTGWTGGNGDTPGHVGEYVGTTGFVTDITAAIDIRGSQGQQGQQGQDGTNGSDGASAYQVAVNNGFSGNEQSWLASLHGADGQNGTNATPITSITDDGNGNLTIHTSTADFGPFELKGPQGDTGGSGADGLSAYQVAVNNGFSGNESQWLASLTGPTGPASAWGTIPGTLSDQTDLQSALNAKLTATNNLGDLTNAVSARTNLGLGTAATLSSTTWCRVANNLSDLTNAATARTNLGLGSIATQAASAVAITGGTITGLTGLAIRSTGAAFDLTLASSEVLTAGRTLSLNLGDAARTLALTGSPTLSGVTITGAGTIATGGFTLTVPATGTAQLTGAALALGGFSSISGTLAVANGGTGVTSFGTGVATMLGQAVTGSGGSVLATSPTLVTPILGTPTSGTLTNCTGLPAAGVVGTAAVLGANTFTAQQTITQGTANAPVLTSTGYSLTGSNASSMLDLAGTWNTTGTPTALKLALTNTASNTSSLLLDLLAGSAGTTSRFKVSALGTVTIGGAGSNSSIIFQGSGSSGTITTSLSSNGYGDALTCSNALIATGFQSSSGGSFYFRSNGNLGLGSGSTLGFSSTSDGAGTLDTILVRDGAANTLALKNSTNAQTFRVYGTTASSKYLSLAHDGTNAIISASSGTLKCTSALQLANANTTGAGAALLGSNSPAATLTAPYTWETVKSSDGSTCYLPLWK